MTLAAACADDISANSATATSLMSFAHPDRGPAGRDSAPSYCARFARSFARQLDLERRDSAALDIHVPLFGIKKRIFEFDFVLAFGDRQCLVEGRRVRILAVDVDLGPRIDEHLQEARWLRR